VRGSGSTLYTTRSFAIISELKLNEQIETISFLYCLNDIIGGGIILWSLAVISQIDRI
jgi:hypothetical protein